MRRGQACVGRSQWGRPCRCVTIPWSGLSSEHLSTTATVCRFWAGWISAWGRPEQSMRAEWWQILASLDAR